MESALINLTVAHRGTTHSVSAHLDDTLQSLHSQLEEITGVSPDNQKLLFKGKKVVKKEAGEVTLTEVGLKDGLKVQMLGSTTQGMSKTV